MPTFKKQTSHKSAKAPASPASPQTVRFEAQPLAGLTVLELGSYLAGPLVGLHLKQLGARVIAIVRPQSVRGAFQEATWRPETVAALREGKQLLELDLDTEDGANIVRKLIKDHVDVVIENFRPGVVTRWSLDAKSCRSMRPDLVYLSMPGFATTDPAFAETPAWEPVIMAVAGVFRDMGVNRQLMGVPASYSPLPLASAYGSVLGALSVVSALYRRAKGGAPADVASSGRNSGPGETIEVPLASALLDTLVHNSIDFECPERYLSPRQRTASGRKSKANRTNWEPLHYEEVQELMDPFYNHYRCSDGRPFYLVAPAHLRHQQRALMVLGVEDEVRALGVPLAEPYVGNKVAGAREHGLGAGQVGDDWAPVLHRLMRRAFLKKTAFDWETLFGDAGVPGAAHRTTTEWLKSEHAREAGLSVVDESGTVRPGSLAWVFEEVSLNVSTEDALPELAASPHRPVQAKQDLSSISEAAWLDGVRVLDLANVIAGPTIGAMLARFGADVIKVDAPTPLYAPEITVLYGMAANIGKRSALINLKDTGSDESADGNTGKAALAALVARSDLVVANCTTECLERLGLSPAALKRMNPRAILVRFDAWGGPKEGCGKRCQHLGYDDNVQAAMGIMARFGGGLGRVEEHAHVGTIDVIAGVGGALAAVAALLHRERGLCHGGGTIIARASLSSLGQVLQFPFCCGRFATLEEEAAMSATAAGTDCRGDHALLQCYRASDSEWFMLAASILPWSEVQRQTIDKVADADDEFAEAIARASAAADTHDDLELHLRDELTEVIESSSKSAEDWVALLSKVGIPSARLRSIAEVREMHRCNAVDLDTGPTFQFITDPAHPVGSPVTMFAPCSIRPQQASLRVALSPAPRYGEHTVQILREVGVDPHALLTRGVAATQWSDDYLPGLSTDKKENDLPAHDKEISLTLPGFVTEVRKASKGSKDPQQFRTSPESRDAIVRKEISLTLPGFVTEVRKASKESKGSVQTAFAKADMRKHWRDASIKKAKENGIACPICFEEEGVQVELSCSHRICSQCAIKCSEAGHGSCPTCRQPHLLDPSDLLARNVQWRQQYGGWRAGRALGAKGEVSSIGTPTSHPSLGSDCAFFCTSAGILSPATSPESVAKPTTKSGVDHLGHWCPVMT